MFYSCFAKHLFVQFIILFLSCLCTSNKHSSVNAVLFTCDMQSVEHLCILFYNKEFLAPYSDSIDTQFNKLF